MYIATDLHGHTLFSDGRATPEEYVDFRRQQALRAVAISDHDVLAGVERGAAAAARFGMIFIFIFYKLRMGLSDLIILS